STSFTRPLPCSVHYLDLPSLPTRRSSDLVWQTRVQVALGNATVDFTMMSDILTQPFFFWFYIIGIISTTFHLANGLWSFCVSWSITQSPKSQKIVTYVTLLVFLVTSYIGVRTIIEFSLSA